MLGNDLSSIIQSTLRLEIGHIETVRSIHGREMKLIIEHSTSDNMVFANKLRDAMLMGCGTIAGTKWNRVYTNHQLLVDEVRAMTFFANFTQEQRRAR